MSWRPSFDRADVELLVVSFLLAALNTALWFASIVIVLLGVSGYVFGQVQLCRPEKLAALKATLPATVDPRWQQLFHDARTVYYTTAEMPPAYQNSVENGDGLAQYFHDARNNPSADPSDAPLGDGRGGNANVVFPWRVPGGVDAAENDVSPFTFFRLPDRDSGGVWPVVYWHELRGGDVLGRHRVMVWAFPIGTTFGEVLRLKDSTGKPHTFEVRLRFRSRAFWSIDILRPYPSAGDLIAALEQLGTDEATAVAAQLRATTTVAVVALKDRHRTRNAFAAEAPSESLPAMSESLVKRLLAVPFRRSAGVHWRETDSSLPDLVAPTSLQRFGLVPRGYTGAFLGNDSQSCAECHRTTLRHAREFDAGRGWYGFVRGSDGILSWNPVEPGCVSDSGNDLPVVLRRSFLSAGILQPYDPRTHPPERYTLFKP